jgi:threonine dehydrogenase-like Zn-dependent dehydrogenase
LGAETVYAIDDVPERLRLAADAGAVTLDMSDEFVYDRLQDLTGGTGPDACVDAVGMEAHGMTMDAAYDRLATATYMATGRAHALRQAINCCQKGGTVSVPGVYGGFVDKFPMGAVMNKGLTIRSGQTHVQKYLPELLERIGRGEIDPSVIITHHVPLGQAPQAYEMFCNKRDGCIKVVLKP